MESSEDKQWVRACIDLYIEPLLKSYQAQRYLLDPLNAPQPADETGHSLPEAPEESTISINPLHRSASIRTTTHPHRLHHPLKQQSLPNRPINSLPIPPSLRLARKIPLQQHNSNLRLPRLRRLLHTQWQPLQHRRRFNPIPHLNRRPTILLNAQQYRETWRSPPSHQLPNPTLSRRPNPPPARHAQSRRAHRPPRSTSAQEEPSRRRQRRSPRRPLRRISPRRSLRCHTTSSKHELCEQSRRSSFQHQRRSAESHT